MALVRAVAVGEDDIRFDAALERFEPVLDVAAIAGK